MKSRVEIEERISRLEKDLQLYNKSGYESIAQACMSELLTLRWVLND